MPTGAGGGRGGGRTGRGGQVTMIGGVEGRGVVAVTGSGAGAGGGGVCASRSGNGIGGPPATPQTVPAASPEPEACVSATPDALDVFGLCVSVALC